MPAFCEAGVSFWKNGCRRKEKKSICQTLSMICAEIGVSWPRKRPTCLVTSKVFMPCRTGYAQRALLPPPPWFLDLTCFLVVPYKTREEPTSNYLPGRLQCTRGWYRQNIYPWLSSRAQQDFVVEFEDPWWRGTGMCEEACSSANSTSSVLCFFFSLGINAK